MTLRRTPFYAAHVEEGGRLVPFAGFELPVQYVGVKPEHIATRTSAGLFDVSHMGEVRVTGPKAEAALMQLLSGPIKRLKPGFAQYNMMCNREGGVVDDVFVYRLGAAEFLVCVNAANREKDFQWMLDTNSLGATFVDEGERWAQLAIQGPNAVAIVTECVKESISKMKRHEHRTMSFCGVEGCIVARTGYTGEDGFEVFIPAERSFPVWKAVRDAGRAHGLVPCGLGARDTLRLEAGNCLYGHELSETINPLTAGVGWTIKMKKPGGFIGRDAIASSLPSSTQRLVKIRMNGRRIAREGMKVLVEDEVVGRITSGTFGPSVGGPIALAFLNKALCVPGQVVTIDVRGKQATGTVIKGSFLSENEQ